MPVIEKTYQKVQVYELYASGIQVMRRPIDDYVNATHVLKVAGLDKPDRTRVLENEVKIGSCEKIQGGYGKFQGTWMPYDRAVQLALKHGVFTRLRSLFEYKSTLNLDHTVTINPDTPPTSPEDNCNLLDSSTPSTHELPVAAESHHQKPTKLRRRTRKATPTSDSDSSLPTSLTPPPPRKHKSTPIPLPTLAMLLDEDARRVREAIDCADVALLTRAFRLHGPGLLVGPRGVSPLHYAASSVSCTFEMLEFLARFQDVAVRDARGLTPLVMLCCRTFIDSVWDARRMFGILAEGLDVGILHRILGGIVSGGGAENAIFWIRRVKEWYGGEVPGELLCYVEADGTLLHRAVKAECFGMIR
ncbi:hypothetical protein HK096_006098, partial [Nowakowskiella sp. JEL0078]